MKLNFKSLAIIAAAATIGMTACSKENDETTLGENGEPTTVSIALTQTQTKSVGDPQNQTAVTFGSGYVLFTNSMGVVVKKTEIVPGTFSGGSDQTAHDAGNKVWLNDITQADGGVIKNVPGYATTVYIIGNYPASITQPSTAENITVIKQRLMSIESQNSTDGSTKNVTLYGDGATLEDNLSDPGTKYAKLEVNAIASRIEVSKVSYQNSPALITGFQVDGIFINYYHNEMDLSSTIFAAPINNAPANNTLADAMYAGGSTEYPNANNGLIYDFNENGIGSTGTAISHGPAAGKVWAYNVFAPLAFKAPATAVTAPHIVIRLSEITTTEDEPMAPAYATTQYLTVKEFKKKGTETVISELTPGYVYTIADLKFNESHLSEIPESETVSVYVEAELMNWTTEEIDWGF